MAFITITPHTTGLLDYIKEGKAAVTRMKVAMRKVLNVGRTTSRRLIASQFTPRTGFLKRQAGKMQTKLTVKASEISGKVTPIPRLLNIFESGATLSNGRGHLRARPVVGPAQLTMDAAAVAEFNQVLNEVGK